MQPGTIGVFLNDSRDNPRLFRFVGMYSCANGYFEPVDDQGARIVQRMRDFWPLLDSLP